MTSSPSEPSTGLSAGPVEGQPPPQPDSQPQPQPFASGAVASYWRGWAEIRADLRSSVLLISGLGLAGIPAGVLWWLLAPRLDFRITSAGPVPVDPAPTSELLIADDAVFAMLLFGIGLLVGILAWRMRRHRGVATVVAISLGTAVCAALAWQVGEFLGAGPTRAELTHVGGLVTTSLTLGSLPALAFAPFAAVLAYLVAVLYTRSDDLGRAGLPGPPVAGPAPDPAAGGEIAVS